MGKTHPTLDCKYVLIGNLLGTGIKGEGGGGEGGRGVTCKSQGVQEPHNSTSLEALQCCAMVCPEGKLDDDTDNWEPPILQANETWFRELTQQLYLPRIGKVGGGGGGGADGWLGD